MHGPGYCATYDICGHRPDGDPLSCPNNTAAQPLGSPAALQKLQAVCPQLAADVGAAGGSSYCCTEQQLDKLQSQVRPLGPGPDAGLAADQIVRLLLTRHACLLIHLLCLQIQIASIFLVGCPACNHNFKHFFCLLTCSPDQASFSNVTAAQTAADTNATAVAGIDYFVSGGWVGGYVGQAWQPRVGKGLGVCKKLERQPKRGP